MNIIVYNFSYGGTLKKAISKTVSLLYNSMIGGFVLFIYMLIIAEINYRLKYIVNDNIVNVFQLIEVLLGIAILSYFIIPSFFRQKVELSDRIVRVYRHVFFFFFLLL